MKKKTIFLAVLFLTMSWLGQAQLTPDDSCNSSFEDISTSGTALGLGDDGEANITLPFAFVLDGVSSSDLRVGNNGGVLFNTTSGDVSTGYSAPTAQGFYPFNDDIDNDYGDVYWQVLGTAPNRYAVIQWNDRPHYSNSPSGATFEVILYETTNEVKFIYQDLDFGAGNVNNDAASARILIIGANGSYEYSANTALPAGVTCIHWTIPSIVNPTATFTATGDCANDRYTVDVNVTDLGGAASVTVADDQGNSSQLLAAGPVVMGPYPSGITVNFSVTNDGDANYVTNGSTVFYCPPVNDECDNAIALTVNNDLNCGSTTSGTTVAATQSSQADDVTGYPTNDVWFSFVATNTSHQISLSNVTPVIGTSGDMGMGLYDASAGCGSLTLVEDSDPNSFLASGLTVGTNYMLRVYGWSSSSSSSAQTTFDVCIGTPPPPPVNDDCDNAIALTVNPDLSCAVKTSGTTAYATDSPQADDVVGTPNKDVWFSFVATNTSHVLEISNKVAVVGSSVDLCMAVYDATNGCSNLTKIDDSDPDTFEVTGLTVGTSYLVRVYGYYSSTSAQVDFDICIGTTPPPPANNDCANAVPLTVYAPNQLAGNEVAGDTSYATDSGVHPTCDTYGPNLDVYYSFTVPAGQTEVAVVTGGANGALSEVALYDSCGGTEIGCVSVWGGIDEKVFSGLTPGETYIIQLWHDGGSIANQGPFTIGVIAPLNDTCERAKEVQLSDLTCNHSVIGNNTVATDSGVAAPSCSSYAGGDLWYSVVVPASGRLTFETSSVAGSGISDTGLAVYSGTCGSLTEVACDDDGGAGAFSKIAIDGLTAGDVLYARVFEYNNNNFGDFKLCIFETPPPPVNNDCGNATALNLYNFAQSAGHETTADTTYGTMSANGHDPSCDPWGTNVDLFYTFLLPPGETGIRILTGGDKGASIEAAIYDSCGGTQVACEGTGSLKVINGLTGGQQYTLQVWHDAGSAQGEFTIALEKLPTPPSNDVCTGAWNLAVYPAGGSAGNETSGNSQYATDSGTQPSCTTSAIQDFYYQFTVPSGVTDVTVLPGGAKGTKLGITVYDSCGGAEVVCEEGSYFHILHGLTSGATYTLQAWHKTTDKGEYTIALEVADVPVNDDCANAKIVPSLPYINTMDASYATGMDLTCSNGMNDGVWYQFTGDGSDVTITATPDGWDNEIAVYTGTCGSLVCETRTDVHGPGIAESLTFTSVAGQVYLVDIGHYTKWSDKPEGPFTIEITSVASAISDNTIDGFSYYPNPVNNSLNLSAQNDIQNIMIFDMTGKEVMNITPNTMDTQVDMSRLNSGMYFVKVRINDQLTAFKVVKE